MEQEALRPRRGLRAGGRWEGEAAERTYCERKKRSPWRALGIEEAVAGTLTQGSCVCRDGRGRACVGAGWSPDVKKVRVQGTWGQAPGETLREQEGPRLPLQPREGKRQEQASPAPKEEGEAGVPGVGLSPSRSWWGGTWGICRQRAGRGGFALEEGKGRRALPLGERCLCVACRRGGYPRTVCVGIPLAGLNRAGAAKPEVWARPRCKLGSRWGGRPGGEG